MIVLDSYDTTTSLEWWLKYNHTHTPTHIKFSRQQRRAVERVLSDKSLTEQDKENKIGKIRKQNEIKSI